MNTEKIEKLKKALNNSKIPADLKPKIEAEIKRLESLNAVAIEKAKEEKEEAKEEAKEETKPVAKTRKPRAKKTSTAKPSENKKPKRTAMSLAKEIRKEGESWKDARARASKMMKEGSKEVAKKVESELDKLTKLVNRKKELRSQVGKTDLLRDAKRKAKPMGRRISKDGNVYYENRANRTDRGTYGKYHLAEGGYLTDPTFGNFQNQVFAGGGAISHYKVDDKIFIDYDDAIAYCDRNNLSYDKIIKTKEYATGGYLTDPTFGNFQNQVFEGGGGVKPTLKKGDNVVVIGRRWFDRVNGNTYHTAMVLVNGQSLGKSRMTYGYDEQYLETAKEILLQYYNLPTGMEDRSPLWKLREYGVTLTKTVSDGLKRDLATGGSVTNERKHVNHEEDYEVRYAKPRPSRTGYRGKRSFELGGTVVSDLAGHTGGSLGGDSTILDGFSGTQYTGLVGETGAMSSGEMFMAGGTLPSGAEQSYMITESFGNPAQHYAGGGKVEFVEKFTMKDGIQVLKDKTENGKVFYSATITSYPLYKMIPMNEDKQYVVNRAKKIYSDMLEYKKSEQFENQHYQEKFYDSRKRFAKGGGVRRVGNREYSYGRNWTNDHNHVNKGEEHEVKYNRKGKFLGVFNEGGALTNERLHVNHNEDYEVRYAKPRPSRKGYNGKRKFMAGGMNNETPRIYVADLEAYNNGRLVGEWLDLSDYNDADELMDAIQGLLDKWGVEEYAIHDAEYIPRSMYSEYMGQRDFEELYEMMDLAKNNDLPLEVVQEVVSQYGSGAVDEFYGKYDSADDFAQQMVDDLGIQSFIDFERYLIISETDRRLLAQEMADSYVDDIRDEDGGNRLIEEAGMDVSEYEDADADTQEEMLDKAREIVYDEYYDTWYDGLNDPYYFLVEEQGMYDAESFANANFVQIDYEALADALEYDYAYVYSGGDLYVFNIR